MNEVSIELLTKDGRPVRTPEQIVEDVRRADWRPTMEDVIQVLEDDHKERFELDQTPEGGLWPALSPVTIAKKGHDTKLEEFGFLRESLTEEGPLSIREITDTPDEKTIKFGTRRKFAASHQYGTKRIPQRRFLGASQRAKEKITSIISGRLSALVRGE